MHRTELRYARIHPGPIDDNLGCKHEKQTRKDPYDIAED